MPDLITPEMPSTDVRLGELIDLMVSPSSQPNSIRVHMAAIDNVTGVLDALSWRLARASGTALVLVDAEGASWRLRGQAEENARRDLATPHVLGLVTMAFIEGRYSYAQRIGTTVSGGDTVGRLVADASHPTYTEIRNFLCGELDARYVDACRAAFAALVSFNRRFSTLSRMREWYYGFSALGERGWL